MTIWHNIKISLPPLTTLVQRKYYISLFFFPRNTLPKCDFSDHRIQHDLLSSHKGFPSYSIHIRVYTSFWHSFRLSRGSISLQRRSNNRLPPRAWTRIWTLLITKHGVKLRVGRKEHVWKSAKCGPDGPTPTKRMFLVILLQAWIAG